MRRLIILAAGLIWVAPLSAQDYQLYVSDAGNFGQPPWQILKYGMQGDNPEIFINDHLAWPHDILFQEDAGTVLVTNFNSGNIERYDAQTGEHIDTFASGIPGPTRMKVGPDGLLYVLSGSSNQSVKRYQADGAFVDNFALVGLPRCLGLDWDRQGNLYVSSYDLQVVRKFNDQGVDQGNFINHHLNGPTNIWFDDKGDLLVVDYDAGVVARFDENGAYLGDFIVGLSEAEGVDFLPDGTILIGNGGTSSVRSFSADGTFLEEFISSQSGGLMQPNSVVVRIDEVQINAGMNDAWYDPATSGQGFLMTVYPDRQELFVAWFTYETERPPDDVTAILGEPGHRWLTAQGPFNGSRADLTLHLTTGGVFNSPSPPAITDQEGYGIMTVEFRTCREARITYQIPSLGLSGEIPVRRIAEDNVVLCEALR